MTYDEIQEKYPGEFSARRANKLYYRYPGIGGESYLGKFLEYVDCELPLTITTLIQMSSIEHSPWLSNWNAWANLVWSLHIESSCAFWWDTYLTGQGNRCHIWIYPCIRELFCHGVCTWWLTCLLFFSLFEIRPKPYGNELRVWKYNEEEDVFEERTSYFKDK